MKLTPNLITAVVSSEGLAMNDVIFDTEVALVAYRIVLGESPRTIEAGGPAPYGYRSPLTHVFDQAGIYLGENHNSGLIESVNFVFDPLESRVLIDTAFDGKLIVFGLAIKPDMREIELRAGLFQRDLPGEYSASRGRCVVFVSAIGRRTPSGNRSKHKKIVSASVCFNSIDRC